MEKCKFCQAEMTEGSTVCPSCGKDNAETAKKATPAKIALAVAAVVVLAAVIIALLVSNLGGSAPEADQTLPQETVAATIPADGNPDDETCKGSYTASDADALAAHDTVVATIGEHTLTNGQLQVYYWMEVQSFLANYSYYLSYLGLDYTQGLDTQACTMAEGVTWQQFFLANAIQSWRNNQALAAEAEANGFQLAEEYQAYINDVETNLENNALAAGFASAEEFLAYNVGAAATVEDYRHYMELYYPSNLYYAQQCQAMTYTLEDVEAYFAENEEAYAENGITKDGKYVDVRHILVFPEGADNTTIRSETFSEEAWAVGEANAQAILDQWLAGEQTEESFAALANEKSQDPGSNTNGGLYTNVVEGQMVAEFENWCFDESRKPGDTGIVKTELGYHVMYFVGSNPIWYMQAANDMLSERAAQILTETVDKYPVEIQYENVLLAYVNMGGEPVEETAESAAESAAPAAPADNNVWILAGISIAALAAAAFLIRKKEEE